MIAAPHETAPHSVAPNLAAVDATAPRGVPGNADDLFAARISAGLVRVEERLREAVVSEDSFVAEAARYLIEAGGKRFRPTLVLMAAETGDPATTGVVSAGVAVELTHLATLYHDDVMDEAMLRRGTPAANRRWNNSIAILTGDFLFARASEIAADLGLDVVRLLSRTLAQLCEGQLRETQGPADGQDPVVHYLRVVRDKTASLTAASCRIGALVAGASPHDVAVLERYGDVVGTAFQIADDLLDISAAAADSGKSPGTDLREGIRTLPVLYALADDDPSPDAVRLRALLAGDLSGDAALLDEALYLLRASSAMDRARRELDAITAEARELAGRISKPAVRSSYMALADYVTARRG